MISKNTPIPPQFHFGDLPHVDGERSLTEGTPTKGRISKHDVCESDRVEPNGVSQDGEREWEGGALAPDGGIINFKHLKTSNNHHTLLF